MKVSENNCLNCDNKLTSNYCEHCGQIASTKRFSLKQIAINAFLLGFFTSKKGFFHTIKSLFTRPGYFIKEYIHGKRVTYLHFLTLLLLLIGISIFTESFLTISFSDLSMSQNKEILIIFETFTKNNPKFFVLIQIPVFSIISYFWFSKANQNFAEHIIINTYRASAELVVSILFMLIILLNYPITTLQYIHQVIIPLIAGVYMTILYYQYFNSFYQDKLKLLLRIILFTIVSFLTVTTIIVVIALVLFSIQQ